ncbi:isochorismate synthase [Hymenobacter luteus]|uniref:Isochorismate synthase n=2 Tax=Hymenobacter TaxID=89966 RepID=A0A7W9T3F1_9BACT|nr:MULTISPECIES: chorismate-binding protein [Hymenobacter]MBB4602883.1 isochorismate synthase [Hymenobacter latericoloratus]MBB6060775.1 isochorismate synthase [Hymenobacter luteus]
MSSLQRIAWKPELPVGERLRRLVALALTSGRPVALWRLPGAEQPRLCLSLKVDSAYIGLPPALEPTAPAGFAFFPFRDSDHNPPLFLPADLFFDLAKPEEIQVSAAAAARLPELRQRFATLPETTELPWHLSRQPAPATASQAEYEALVAAGVAAIEAGTVQKVVSSRAVRRPLPAGFDALAAFAELQERYPNAFVSLVSAPGVGTWLGATPEVLAEIDEDQVFRTMALAGTQPLLPGMKPATAKWAHKDLEEHAMVARYIVNCFKQLRLREYDERGPRTVAAGQMLHLRTDFAVYLTQVPFPTLGTDMLRLLHPTPAVGGVPKQPALEFLRRHEGYDRAYYAGFLGPVNLPDAGVARLYVNLRCLQLRAQEAILYAGTGLTSDSDPAREWQETELKLRTVGAILQEPSPASA